jgi:hypothetical protein
VVYDAGVPGVGEAVTSAQLAACPFTPCEARPQLHYQRAQDEFGRASNHALISMHVVGGGEWFGTCPASLMAHPIMPHERGILDDFTGTFLAMAASRERTHVETADRISSSLRDQGWRKARWFRSSNGDPNGGGANAAGPRLRLVSDLDDSKQKGGAMASVSEIRAALDAANQAIAEAQAANQACGQKLEDARAALLGLKGSTGQDLSIPMIEQAIEQQEIILQLTHAAIEHNATYGATL